MRFLTLLALCAPAGALLSSAYVAQDYADPGGAFALSIPSEWRAQRAPVDAQTTLFEFGKDEYGPHITITSVQIGAGGTTATVESASDVFLNFTVAALNQEGTVLSQKKSGDTFAGKKSVRCDLSYRDSEDRLYKGVFQGVLGSKFYVAVLGYWPDGKADHQKAVEQAMASFALESPKPGAGSSSVGGSIFSAAQLKDTASKVKAGFQRDQADKVLADGNPPLRLGSVVAFVELLHDLFGAELTESEFELTKERFIEYYKKNDAAGQEIIVNSGKRILEGIRQGTPEEKAKNQAEVRGVFVDRLKTGSEKGIEWAQVLWGAIERRNHNLKEVKAARPASTAELKMDKEFSEGDLQASLEMLYFMWVACGRDASLVTPEAVSTVGQLLVARFDTFDPQLQWVLANAQKVYSGLRAQWQQATPAQRLQMAQTFSAQLDWLGLTVPRPGGGGGGGRTGSAWDDVAGTDSGTLRGQLMQNSAFLATNSWQR